MYRKVTSEPSVVQAQGQASAPKNPQTLYISSLSLTDFRNFKSFRLSFDDRGNVFHGRNGIGKTNLLEAICYLAFGKSFRVNTDLDLIRYNQDLFRIKGIFSRNKEVKSFEAAYDKRGRKQIKIDSHPVVKLSELYRLLKVVLFDQNDINLVGGSPKQRRHFFDLAISQFNYRYIDSLKKYNQTVKQRNFLLKEEFKEKEKEVWDDRLAKTAAEVIEYRYQYLSEISRELNAVSDIKLNNNLETLGIKYVANVDYPYQSPPQYATSVNSTEQTIKRELIKREKEELYYQRTLIGPHLDDYRFTLNSKDISRFGSHGQKRCFVILLGIAQSQLISKTDKDEAIMIFDDVLSDLDRYRTKALLLRLMSGNNQIFIATPNPEPYRELELPFIDMEKESTMSRETVRLI